LHSIEVLAELGLSIEAVARHLDPEAPQDAVEAIRIIDAVRARQ